VDENTAPPAKKWTLAGSVFKPRKKEAASRDFYDR